MTADLQLLAASAVLTVLLIAPYGLYMWTHWPLMVVLGNREEAPELPAWAQRSRRAQLNMLENFPHFAALVLVAHVAGVNDGWTALGAAIFFWARVAHAGAYISGFWPLRAPAFFVGLAGEALIAWRLAAAII